MLQSARAYWLEDFPFCELPIMSGAAAALLRPLLERDGEFVPLLLVHKSRTIAAEYYLYNCTRSCDAINMRKTRTEMLEKDGRLHPTAPTFFAFSKIPNKVNAFRCYQTPSSLFVSAQVVEALAASKLTGWWLCPRGERAGRRALVSPYRPSRDSCSTGAVRKINGQ